MAYPVDTLFYEMLAVQKPDEVCRRALCRYDSAQKCYVLSAWGDEYVIDPDNHKIYHRVENHRPPHDYFAIFLIHYLLGAKQIETRNQWVSEKDIPGGTTFFRGPHQIPTNLITQRHGSDLAAFGNCCQQLGGARIDLADAAYTFFAAPRIPLAVLYWQGDDEFGPEAGLLYDRSISAHLALDAVYALAVDTCARIGANQL